MIHNTILKNFMIFAVFLLSGCAGVSESIKGFAGYPTRILEQNRGRAIVKTLDYDYFTAYTKITDILKWGNTHVYIQDIKKHLIALYVSEDDTTAVGIFFTEKSENQTQIEISSPSVYGKEVIAKKITLGLEEKKNGAEE